MEGNPVPTNVTVASYALQWYRNRIKEMCDDAARRRPYEMLFVLQYRDGLSAVEARIGLAKGACQVSSQATLELPLDDSDVNTYVCAYKCCLFTVTSLRTQPLGNGPDSKSALRAEHQLWARSQ